MRMKIIFRLDNFFLTILHVNYQKNNAILMGVGENWLSIQTLLQQFLKKFFSKNCSVEYCKGYWFRACSIIYTKTDKLNEHWILDKRNHFWVNDAFLENISRNIISSSKILRCHLTWLFRWPNGKGSGSYVATKTCQILVFHIKISKKGYLEESIK